MPTKSLSEIFEGPVRRTAKGLVSAYYFEIRHSGLREVKTVGDRDRETAIRKAKAQCSKWDEKWEHLQQQAAVRDQKRASKEQAEARTEEAERALEAASTLLTHALASAKPLDWSTKEDHTKFEFVTLDSFPLVAFGKRGTPAGIKAIEIPLPPDEADTRFDPGLTWLDGILKSRRIRKVTAARERYDAAFQEWTNLSNHAEERKQLAVKQLTQAVSAYEAGEAAFVAAQLKSNAPVAELKRRYLEKESEAVAEYCEEVLSKSEYPAFFEPEFDVGYNPANGIAVVECELPDKHAIPTLLKVTFSVASGDFKEKHTSEGDRDKLYDLVLYQVALRTIFELFKADVATALEGVVFNGWVNSLNPATGKRTHGCLLSIQAGKKEFDAIDLTQVEPRACFRQLKGVSAARLSGMTPVRPILQLDKEDPRFVTGHEVVSGIEDGYNLATMDWEEFEHLVRQLFEGEFARGGAEVHVTRASADGGVDAIVLDPDPIRGGKIVIQAKRYTNTVGLSAVRDLYGTVINEGANRGILVSTADYGPDSYEFVKGKPISLLNGANLLHLLEKHGHKARIDLREAKIVNLQNKQDQGGSR